MSPVADLTLWNALPVPAFVTDAGGAILEANAGAEAFVNTPARRLVGRALEQVLSGDPALARAVARAAAGQGPVFVNNTALGPDAPCGEVNIQMAQLGDGSGRLLVLVSPCRLAGELGQAGAVRSAARSAIGMAEMLAHEIKNPLAGITGAAQLLEMELSPADRELTGLIVAESRRIVALLEQVEQFGNLRPPVCRAENIHDLIDRARRSAAVGFAAHMTFVEEYDPSLPPTWVDADQMMQVFLNLMKNAAEASPQGGTITLRTSYDHALRLRPRDGAPTRLPLQVEIIDDGPGLPDDIAGQVFEPFVSGRENGTGLGLALVSKIITEHGAWIRVDSRPGRTAFRISLPRAPRGAAASTTPAATPSKEA